MEDKDILRELTDQELGEVAGGNVNVVDIDARNVGVGQLNVDSTAFRNLNIGIGFFDFR